MESRCSPNSEMQDKQHAHGKLGNQASKSYGEIEEIIDPLEEEFKEFNKFDMLSYPPDDHYFFHKKSTKFNEKTLKVIQRDLEILDLALLPTFYFRAYESRLDLVRAVIVGPACTPYCGGLFFFDIQLPSNYPHQLPQIYSHSHGLEIDPYLNKKGKVSRYFWNSKEKSSLRQFTTLQVLSTLSASLFNDERLSDKLPAEKERFSKEAFMKSHYDMLHSLAYPPFDFYIFVKGYFRTRAHQILLNYKAHMASDSSGEVKSLFLRLVNAFEGNGTYCGHHHRQHSSLPEEVDNEPPSYFSYRRN